MKKYEFKNKMSGLISEGYLTIRVIDGIVTIDENNPDAVKLVESLGGQLVKEKSSKRGKKS